MTSLGLIFINLFIAVFGWILIARVVLSWLSPRLSDSSVGRLLIDVTEPVLAPVRKVIPSQTIDLSPLIVFFLLQVLAALANHYIH